MIAERGRPRAGALAMMFAGTLVFAGAPSAALARDPAAAEALFRTGRDLLAQGNFAEACPKFEASFALDPVASTLLNIAKCREHEGKLATAWADNKRALVLNQETPGAERQKTLADLAEQSIAALEPRLPRLTLRVDPRFRTAKVQRDGVVVPEGSFGVEVPIDPGAHVVIGELAGHTSIREAFDIKEAEHKEITLTFAASDGASAAPAPATETSRGVPAWIWITGGAGLAAVGAGVAFRVHGLAAEDRIEEACGADRMCNPRAPYDPADDNQTKNVDFGLFMGLTIAGGVAIVATVVGAIVDVASDSSGSASAVIAPDGSLRVRF
jgi:hypothetical protein